MSGGSYNYLYCKELYWDDLDGDDLDRMIDRLAGVGYAEDAAKEAREMQLLIRQSKVRIGVIQQRLSEVFQAVEWWDSADTGEEDLKDALAKYRNIPAAKP